MATLTRWWRAYANQAGSVSGVGGCVGGGDETPGDSTDVVHFREERTDATARVCATTSALPYAGFTVVVIVGEVATPDEGRCGDIHTHVPGLRAACIAMGTRPTGRAVAGGCAET